MPTTSNFGWTTPADTDLVKDGAAAIRTLGNGIDTSFLDLKGGTTGQVLAKASNTDLDFTWSAADPLSILDAKGDLITATAADTPARLAVGTNGQVLKADSTTATGLVWGDAGGAPNLTLLNSGGTALSGSATVTISGISDKSYFVIYVNGASTSGTDQIAIRFNADSDPNYKNIGLSLVNATMESVSNTSNIQFPIGTCGSASSSLRTSTFVFGGATSGIKYINSTSALTAGANTRANAYSGFWSGSAITSISIVSETNNFDGGTVFIYGA
jgi:hypothetical protein